ncbi:MAG: hypothetical protein KBT34_07065 [Prevotella sp.]|nr:hypothetical protein [Candidatus Prevotella equi]
MKNLYITAALLMSYLAIEAHEFGLEYTTELQTNFKECNFVNHLRLNAEITLSDKVSLEASTISLAKTSEERLLDDLQFFSNIEDENLPISIAVLGVNWQINDKHRLFAGIRNMNEDYFVSPVTSLFTNSSSGVYPTIGANYPIANFPVASVGIHYSYDNGPVNVQASLYNGVGYNEFTGRYNVFRVCPNSDGVFGLAQVEYKHKGGSYFGGASVRYGDYVFDEEKEFGSAIWAYTEQEINNRLSLIGGYSHAFGTSLCTDFIGMGGKYSFAKCELGLFTDVAFFHGVTEWASELTCKINLTKHVFLQPTIHAIMTGGDFGSVAMMRLGVRL